MWGFDHTSVLLAQSAASAELGCFDDFHFAWGWVFIPGSESDSMLLFTL